GGITATASLENPLPAGLTGVGLPQASDGSPVSAAGGVVQWNGSIGPGGAVAIVYAGALVAGESGVVRVVNGARVTDDEGRVYGFSVALNPLWLYLPAVCMQ
ncbi:MAG TPA: hypothetical protein PL105_23705, partial [Caldilineaceae bacterium]|nr:hypothetical protein [Caldilineaceae bacterium]